MLALTAAQALPGRVSRVAAAALAELTFTLSAHNPDGPLRGTGAGRSRGVRPRVPGRPPAIAHERPPATSACPRTAWYRDRSWMTLSRPCRPAQGHPRPLSLYLPRPDWGLCIRSFPLSFQDHLDTFDAGEIICYPRNFQHHLHTMFRAEHRWHELWQVRYFKRHFIT